MIVQGKDGPQLTGFVRKLRGGSQPILALASDGFQYVVKFGNNLQGPNLPFNESMGCELYRACGLAVPNWKPLLLADDFLNQNPGSWIQTAEGNLRPASGWCFGSLYLGGQDVRLLEILPGTSIGKVRNRRDFWLAWLIDVCADHVDERQALFVEEATRALNATFIDHGHLFGGPKGEQSKAIVASRYLDSRIYPSVTSDQLHRLLKIAGSLDVDRLWLRVQHLPSEWKELPALRRFAECLDRLATANFLLQLLDTMVDTMQRDRNSECTNAPNKRKLPSSVLPPGVQASTSERRAILRPARFPACA
jgi:hypothetical protein